MKVIILSEIGVHGSIIKKDAMNALYALFSEQKLPHHIDLHTYTTMIAFVL
jgi:hypothetical protein